MTKAIYPTVLLAGSLLLNACTNHPATDNSYDRTMQLASDLEHRGDHTTATALYERATEQPGANIDTWLMLGTSRLANNDARAAERAFQKALEFKPQNADALLGLGTAQLHLGKLQPATIALTKAADVSQLPAAYSRLGIAQVLSGQPEAAQRAFAKSLNLQPNNLDSRCNLALAYALGGSSQQALDTIVPVVESPLAQARHQRNELLITVLADHEEDVATLPLYDIPISERHRLLVEAQRIKAINDPATQARELGLIDTH